MSDTMNDPNKNDPNKGAMMPTPAEAVDRARPPAQQVRWTARATHRAMEGWRVASEQEHRDIQTTMIYATLMPDELAAGVSAFDA